MNERADDVAAEVGTVPLGQSLDAVVRSLGERPGRRTGSGQGTVSVFRCWDDVVGRPICEHARPVALDDGRLLVEVDQPGWATQLRYLAATVVTQLGEAVGAGIVRTIEVRVARR